MKKNIINGILYLEQKEVLRFVCYKLSNLVSKFVLIGIMILMLIFISIGRVNGEEVDFSRTLFLGDSLTVGMNNSVNMQGMGAVVDAKVSRTISGCIDVASNYHDFDRVIIGIGTNNYGSSVDTFNEEYQELIDIVVGNNPNAIIYINTIPGVNEGKALSNGYTIKNYHVNEKNQLIKTLAENNGLFCMDVNNYLGTISSSDTGDGLHMNSATYLKWFNFICEQICAFEVAEPEANNDTVVEINLTPVPTTAMLGENILNKTDVFTSFNFFGSDIFTILKALVSITTL